MNRLKGLKKTATSSSATRLSPLCRTRGFASPDYSGFALSVRFITYSWI